MRLRKPNNMMIAAIILMIGTFLYSREDAFHAAGQGVFQFWEMLKVLPPIFILIGLLDVWVPRETMIKIMGKESGLLGISIAFLFGTFSAGPLVAAFPVAALMLNKGARYSNVIFFLTIWASAKLPILVFQSSTMGLGFTVVTNITLIIVYLIGSYLLEKSLSTNQLEDIYNRAEHDPLPKM
ncbi:permease [Spirochaeta cellobiosiphila]|uniref:permease n=1 Tax=Spirochaeta cellobiosiphila TaxID=504483 RepID=UPI0004168290|nr:permease [Spirochaeta cellobiosiphila]